jgi:histidinol-phosphate aminotransferase
VIAPVPIRRALARMRPYKPPLEGRAEKVRLDFNENPLGCSPAVRRALARLSSAPISMYPEQETVRRKMAKYFSVYPDELLLTNGTDEALNLVVNTFVEPRSAVLLVEPTFAMYRFYSELAGARVRALRYDGEMQFPMRELFDALRSIPRRAPRALFLANPNSPTGHLLSLRQLRMILKAARYTMVVVDEAYFEFSGVTVLPWINRYANLIVTRTFSKAAGLAGLRLGCIFANREMAASLCKAQSPYPVNVAALAAAEAAMRDRRFLTRTLRELRGGRRELEIGLKRLSIRYFPSAGNFVLVYLGDRAKEIVSALARKGILVRDRSSDFNGEGYVRITFGTVKQMQRLLRQLEEIL